MTLSPAYVGKPANESPALREMELLEKDVEQRPCRYPLVAHLGVLIAFVQIAVEHGKTDEECHADQILYALDVLVVINQCEDFLDRSNLL
jgi:hypothetical protein